MTSKLLTSIFTSTTFVVPGVITTHYVLKDTVKINDATIGDISNVNINEPSNVNPEAEVITTPPSDTDVSDDGSSNGDTEPKDDDGNTGDDDTNTGDADTDDNDDTDQSDDDDDNDNVDTQDDDDDNQDDPNNQDDEQQEDTDDDDLEPVDTEDTDEEDDDDEEEKPSREIIFDKIPESINSAVENAKKNLGAIAKDYLDKNFPSVKDFLKKIKIIN